MKKQEILSFMSNASSPSGDNSLNNSNIAIFPILSDNEIEIHALIAGGTSLTRIKHKFDEFDIEPIDNLSIYAKPKITAMIKEFEALSDLPIDAKKIAKERLEKLKQMNLPVSVENDFNLMRFFSELKHTDNALVSSIFQGVIAMKQDLSRDHKKKISDINNESSTVNIHQRANSNYDDFVKIRAKTIKERMISKWRSLKFDEANPLQNEVASKCYGGRNMLLLGETGIGKTYTPMTIAKNNGIKVNMIQFTSSTDSVKLHGFYEMKQGVFDKEPRMHYQYGELSSAFKDIRQRAKNFEPSFLILDELLRASDMSPLISSLSVVEETDEYNLVLPHTVEFVLMNVKGAGKSWFAITNDVDIRSRWYQISAEERILISKGAPADIFLTEDEEKLQDMHARSDLPTIRLDQLRKLNSSSILGYAQKKEAIRVPKNAVMIIATSNIGENYDVLMGMDNALFRRLSKLPVGSPEVSYMVKQKISKINDFMNQDDKNAVEDIVIKFLETVHLLLGKEIVSTSKINFSTVDDIFDAIDYDNPFTTSGMGGIFTILEKKASDFIDIAPDMSAGDMMSNNIYAQFKEIVAKVNESRKDMHGYNALVMRQNTDSEGNMPSRRGRHV